MGFNIKNNYGPNIDVHDGGVVNLHQNKDGKWDTGDEQDVEEAVVVEELSDGADTRSSEEQPKVLKAAAAPAESFAERVKAIMRKAATKNGQTIKSNARGHEREYKFYVDADAFCKAMDEMAAVYPDRLQVMLGGSLATVQVTKVCAFIGHVIRMQVINDERLQAVDLLFAFEDYYSNLQTVQARLGDRNKSDDQDVALGTFQGLLKKHKS